MTIPGELYLNFGWTALVLGGIALGGIFTLLWSTKAEHALIRSRAKNVSAFPSGTK